MIIRNDSFGNPEVYTVLNHLTDEINALPLFERKKLTSLLTRKLQLISKFHDEIQHPSLKNYVHKALYKDIKEDILNLQISSHKAKTLSINFLVAKMRREFLNIHK